MFGFTGYNPGLIMGVGRRRSQAGRTMQSLLKVFWDIALWRRGPRDLPSSPALLGLVAALYVLTSVVQSWLIYGADLAVLRGLVDLGITAGVFWVCLAVSQRRYRLTQTLTAALGTGVLLALPMIAMLVVGRNEGSHGALSVVLSLLSLPLLIWYLFVVGHIVRLALEAPLFTGMAVAMTYFVLSYVALAQLPQVAGG